MLKASVIGNLGNDPELRYTPTGRGLLRFNVASNYRAKNDANEWVDRTEWVRVTVFGDRAERLAEHLRKGQRVYVDGRLEARPWTDREGTVRAGLELIAADVEFVSARSDAAPPAQQPSRQPAAAAPVRPAGDAYAGMDLEDLPF